VILPPLVFPGVSGWVGRDRKNTMHKIRGIKTTKKKKIEGIRVIKKFLSMQQATVGIYYRRRCNGY
jgi:hypothetical protein